MSKLDRLTKAINHSYKFNGYSSCPTYVQLELCESIIDYYSDIEGGIHLRSLINMLPGHYESCCELVLRDINKLLIRNKQYLSRRRPAAKINF